MVKAEQLCFGYSRNNYILDHLNLEISRGDYVSVVGENGSGKSTLVKLLLKLLKPTDGSINNSAQKIGYVPQKNDFSNGDFPITVFEMLNAYRKLIKIKDKAVVMDSLNHVRMEEYRDALVGNLSGGQSQKIFIARALIGNPDLLVLDEPSTGVDRESQIEVYRFIKHLNRDHGITVVSVDHNLDAAIENSTKIYHIANGKGHMCSAEKYMAEYLKATREEEANA